MRNGIGTVVLLDDAQIFPACTQRGSGKLRDLGVKLLQCRGQRHLILGRQPMDKGAQTLTAVANIGTLLGTSAHRLGRQKIERTQIGGNVLEYTQGRMNIANINELKGRSRVPHGSNGLLHRGLAVCARHQQLTVLYVKHLLHSIDSHSLSGASHLRGVERTTPYDAPLAGHLDFQLE